MKDKLFDEWIGLKKKLHFNNKIPRITEGEIWWCSFGENVGVEINGKSVRFTRPVLIMRKLSKFGFMGIPLTSQIKSGPGTLNLISYQKMNMQLCVKQE